MKRQKKIEEAETLVMLGVPWSTYVETGLGPPELDRPVNKLDLSQGDSGCNCRPDLFPALNDAEVLEAFLGIEKDLELRSLCDR